MGAPAPAAACLGSEVFGRWAQLPYKATQEQKVEEQLTLEVWTDSVIGTGDDTD